MIQSIVMGVRISNQALGQLDKSPSQVVHVEHPDTKRQYVLLPRDTYERARPLLDYVAAQTDSSRADENGNGAWSEELNARRVTLINKKYDSRLTPAEKEELEHLQQQAYLHRSRVAPTPHAMLRAIVEALEQQASQASKPG